MPARTISIFIPDGELPELKRLAQTPIEHLEALETAAGEQEPITDRDALTRLLAKRTGLELPAIGPVISALWKLAFVQRDRDADPHTFLSALEDDLRAKPPDKWGAEDKELWTARRDHFARLLAPDGAIASSAKAADLLLEQQHIFCSARIMTDVRPLFDEHAQCVERFLPFHTMSLAYYEGRETRTMHIAMDSKDLARLRDQVEHAEQKERVIRQYLTNVGAAMIDTGAESGD